MFVCVCLCVGVDMCGGVFVSLFVIGCERVHVMCI